MMAFKQAVQCHGFGSQLLVSRWVAPQQRSFVCCEMFSGVKHPKEMVKL